jgi:chromate transporter
VVADEPPPLVRPDSPGALFTAFTALALKGFGGVLPVAQRTLVDDKRWMSQEQFLELLSMSQVLPGPNIVNMALIFGDRCHGWRGALAAMAGLILAPLALLLTLAALAQGLRGQPLVADALRGMGVVAAGLVLGTAVRLATALRHSPLGLPACALLGSATAVAIGLWRWPLVGVVLGLGGLAMALAWRRVGAA